MTIDLDTITLDKGSHRSPEHGHCLMEVVSMLSGEPFRDDPVCVSPVLRSFGIALNDTWNDKQRQKLKRFIPRLPGTAGDGQDEARSLLALDWFIRVFTPAWLRLVPALASDADLLAQHPPITDLESAAAIGDAVREAASHASAARDAAWASARSAAWASARSAAWASAWDAAWNAAGDVLTPTAAALQESASHASDAGDAAWAAASDAGDAAWAAARDAAWAAAWASAARDAAWDAARDLAPTVAALQESAIDLFDRLILAELPTA